MKSCNIMSAVAYLENLNIQLISDGNTKASALFSSLFDEITSARNDIANKSALAGALPLNIYNRYANVFQPSDKGSRNKTQSKKSPVRQTPPPTYTTVAGFTLGQVKEVEMSELLDLVGEIASHADSNRFGSNKLPHIEDIASMTKLLKEHLGNSGRRIKVELVNQVVAKTKEGETRFALGKVNRTTGVLSIAINPDPNTLSDASLLVSTSKVILQELVHAMTVQTLAENPDMNAKIENLRQHAIKAYTTANHMEPSYEPGSATYGLKTNAEFVAEAVTSADFQRLLAGVNPTRAKTLYQRVRAIFNDIVKSIKTSIGISEDTYTLFDEALEAVGEILESGGEPLTEGEQEVVDTVTDKPSKIKVSVTNNKLTPALLRAHEDLTFVFGDNDKRYGKKGQAVVRDEPNAIGLRTKKHPGKGDNDYYTDNELQENILKIDEDIETLKNAGTELVFPSAGLGTGLSELQERAPKTSEYLNKRLKEEFGFDNPTKDTTTGKPGTEAEQTTVKEESAPYIPQRGDVVSYQNRNYVVRGVNDSGKVQLTSMNTGKNVPGTPNIDKVTYVKSLAPYTYSDGNEYMLDIENVEVYSSKGATLHTKLVKKKMVKAFNKSTETEADTAPAASHDFPIIVIENEKSTNKFNKERLEAKAKLDEYDDANPYHRAKSVYSSSEELKEAGTFEEYLNYVAAIFPLSKVTKVLYHGTGRKFDSFSSNYLGETTGDGVYKDGTLQDSMNATFFSDTKGNTDQYTIIERQEELSNEYYVLRNLIDAVSSDDYVSAPSNALIKALNNLNKVSPDLAVKFKNMVQDSNVTNKDFRNEVRAELKKAGNLFREYGESATINQLGSFSRAIYAFSYLKDNIESMRKDGYKGNPNDDHVYFYTKSDPYSVMTISDDGELEGKASLSKHIGKKVTELSPKDFDELIDNGLAEVEALQSELFENLEGAGFNPTTYSVIINVQDATVYDFQGRTFVNNVGDDLDVSYEASKYTQKAVDAGQDAIIYKDIRDPNLATNYGIFDTQNIHILGNAEDVSMFTSYKETGVVPKKAVEPTKKKPKKASKEPEEETVVGYKFVKGGKTFTTNEGQTAAVNSMKNWFEGKKNQHFLLQGRGGTGKTTVINVLLDKLGIPPNEVMFSAVMHKASKVLEDANKDNKYKKSSYTTIASILALRPDGKGNFKPKFGAKPKKLPKVLIVDEVSTLRSDDYKSLLLLANKYGTRIIFMGDHAQLPPVNDPDPEANIKSVVFHDQKESTTHLNQLMRQEKDSPIITLTDSLISLVNYIEETYEGAKSRIEKIKFTEDAVNNSFKFVGEWFNKYDSDTGKGVIVTEDDFDNILPHLVNDLKDDINSTKYIHYNKHTNKNTIDKTDIIRDALFGKGEKDLFIKGEPLSLNNPYTIYDTEDDMILDNAEEFVVVDSQKVKKSIHYKVNDKEFVTDSEIDVYEITAYSKTRDENFIFLKPVEREDKDINVLIDKLMTKEESKVGEALGNKGLGFLAKTALRSYLAIDLSHGYVINTHKSQGSTYKNVYMDVGNILNVNPSYSDANTKAKSMYVGASRASDKLVVIDERYDGVVTGGVSMSNIPLTDHVLSGVNTVESTEIADEVSKCKGAGN